MSSQPSGSSRGSGKSENQIRKHGEPFRTMTRDLLVREQPIEGLAKQATQIGAVVRAIEEATGPWLVALEQVLVRLEQKLGPVFYAMHLLPPYWEDPTLCPSATPCASHGINGPRADPRLVGPD